MTVVMVILISLVAILAVIYPWFTRRGDSGVTALKTNIAQFEDQKAVLDTQLAAGELDQQTYDLLLVEAKTNLLRDADLADAAVPNDGVAPDENRPGWAIPILLCLLVLTGGGLLYLGTGSSEDIAIAQLLAQRERMAMQGQASPEIEAELYQRMTARVDERPDNVYYWGILGQMEMSQPEPNYAAAAENFYHARELTPQDSYINAQYAQALFFKEQNRFTPEVRQAVDRAYGLDQNNTTVLGLKGVEAFQAEAYQQAIDFWRSALNQLPPNGGEAQAIASGIAAAQQRVGGAGESVQQDLDAAEPLVSVTVSLADDVPFTAGQTVFVFLRRSGERMPLAAKRIPVDLLPTTIALTQGDLMIQGTDIDPNAEVELVARLSHTGNAIPQVGDWEGSAGPFTLPEPDRPVSISINAKIQ